MVYIPLNSFILFQFILYLLFLNVYNDDCMTHSFPDSTYPKAKTLDNGYQLMITAQGIFSFNPQLSKLEYSYIFTQSQKFSLNVYEMKKSINQIEISQFSDEEGGNKLVIIYINNYIYLLTEYGELKFYQELEKKIFTDFSITLVAYKYSNEIYYFIIGHNIINSSGTKCTLFYYYKIINENQIELAFSNEVLYSQNNELVLSPISCQAMIHSMYNKVLTCLFDLIYESDSLLIAFSLNPDQYFQYVCMSNWISESDSKQISYVKSSINNDRTKILFCYSIENLDKTKCINYDINKSQDQLSEVFFTSTYCEPKLFGFNIYYFNEVNEYIFSCVNKYKTKFTMKRIDSNFFLIDENDNTFIEKSFTNCYELNFFSIIYISSNQQYSIISNISCGKEYIRVFSLSNNICEKSEIVEQQLLVLSNTIKTTISKIETTISAIETTIPGIETTIPAIETTIPGIETTIPGIETTIPIIDTTIPIIKTTVPIKTTIITTIPKTNPITTIPEKYTTIPTKTTIIQKKYTTIPEIETTFLLTIPKITITDKKPSLPKIDTSIIYTSIIEKNHETNYPELITTTYLDIKTTLFNKTQIIQKESENAKFVDISTELLCEDNKKINYNGKCICDENKGYYSINYSSSNNKCFKKSDLPKNIYFNNKTHSYELCYKTCATCLKGGNYSENNCLTCVYNYIKEPNKNSSNCVEECKYLYYYNSLNQYTCTEDEQCPIDASLIVRTKNKCINKCSNDETNEFQYNGECLDSCPINTKANENKICLIDDYDSCSTSDYLLNLDKTINQENILLTINNYVNEFYYTINHISRFLSQNYTMIVYKNSSCVDELNLNITTIDYDSCINQLKIDNNIDENKEIVIAIIDIINGDNPITSFGFFDPDTGAKLNASKSCSDKNVIMYENIINILNDPTALYLMREQQINIFDLNNKFYKDICFHFDSPNGKDATLQDRIKTFYPNITLCDEHCKNKGINMTTMKAICECTFQDLLSINLFQNDLIGDNVLIKETLEEIVEMMSNLNLEVLSCYQDIFNFYYFKKNTGGFIILALFIIQTICFTYYYQLSYSKLLRNINLLMEMSIKKNHLFNISFHIKKNPPKKREKSSEKKSKINIFDKTNIINKKKSEGEIDKNEKIDKKMIFNTNNNKVKTHIKKNKMNIKENHSKEINKANKKNIKEIQILKVGKMNLKEYNSKNGNKCRMTTYVNGTKNSMDYLLVNNRSLFNMGKIKSKMNIFKYNKKEKLITVNNKYSIAKKAINNDNSDIKQFLKPNFEGMDFDDIIDEDKRSFCEYYKEKIENNQMIINNFFIFELLRPRSIKITVFILNIDLYFLINGLFYNDSYISEIFNSKEEETFFSFVPRSLSRFFYCTLVGNIIGYIFKFFFVEDFQLKKILFKKEENLLKIKYEVVKIFKTIVNKIKILIVLNYIIILFSWYYISCLNNVYPNIKKEWIKSSLFVIIIVQILPFIVSLLETCIRYLSIKYESEKLFKLSLLFP